MKKSIVLITIRFYILNLVWTVLVTVAMVEGLILKYDTVSASITIEVDLVLLFSSYKYWMDWKPIESLRNFEFYEPWLNFPINKWCVYNLNDTLPLLFITFIFILVVN